ncbi:MAG: SH3 domain-containing protein [bacterium]|nr:SH3 domain-containing protein [bacterium]
MRTAQSAIRTLAISALIAALVTPKVAWAASGNTQICQTAGTCTVGEFLYDDEYAPIASATCTLTSKYPNGTAHLTSQSMTAAADGWYSHEFTAPATLGVYRAQVCCTSGADYMCLDKTFEVGDALDSTDVAGSVWNAARSSYTAAGSFGQSLQTAVSSTSDISTAIWGYSSRSLSTFGTLAADIWASATRTLTGAGSSGLATTTDVTSATTSIKGASNKDLTQVSTEVAGVQTDVTTIKADAAYTRTKVDSIYADTQAIQTDVDTLITKWGVLAASDLSTSIAGVSTKLGASTDADTIASVFGRIEYLRNKWGSQTAQAIYDKAVEADTAIDSVRTELDYSGKSTTAYADLQTLKAYVDTLETLIGTSSDTAAALTLFGKVKKVQDQVDKLTAIETDVDTLLDKWGTLKLIDIKTEITNLRNDLDILNNVPDLKALFRDTINENSTITNLKNELLNIKALSELNRELLEKNTNAPIVKTFLIEGSIIFKTVATNPSSLVSQTANISYYLPSEVGKEDIIKYDEGLTLQYDPEKNSYYVTAEVVLGKSKSKSFSIEVEESVWEISDAEIATLRTQAADLSVPLQKTSYFAQGVTLKTDIDASLDKVSEYQKGNTTPEAKIKGFKDAKIELVAAKAKMDKLKELVANAGSASNLFGFVGGAQAIAVWGLIIIMVAGFVFLVMYMRVLRPQGAAAQMQEQPTAPVQAQAEVQASARPKRKSGFGRAVRFVSIILFVGLLSSAVSGFAVSKIVLDAQKKDYEEKQAVVNEPAALGVNEVAQKEAESTVIATKSAEVQEEVLGATDAVKKYVLIAPGKKTVDLLEKPYSTSLVVNTYPSGTEVEVIGGTEAWKKVALGAAEGWVKGENVKKSIKSTRGTKSIEGMGAVIVTDTPTGFLNVRKAPGGTEITQAYPGDEFLLVRDLPEWWQIELEDGSYGWVSKKYAVADR